MSNNEKKDVYKCRICLTPKELIIPCECRADFAFVHKSCLNDWLQTSGMTFCGICGFKFIMKKESKSLLCWFLEEYEELELYVELCTRTLNILHIILLAMMSVKMLSLNYFFICIIAIIMTIRCINICRLWVLFIMKQNQTFREWKKTNFIIDVMPNPERKGPFDVRKKLDISADESSIREIELSQKKETVFKLTIEELINKNPFRSIRTITYNLTLIVMIMSLLIVFYTLCTLFQDWILENTCYLSREENWILFLHSMITIISQLVIRWDVYCCSIGRQKNRNFTFHFRFFMILISLEFVFITRIIFIFYPIRAMTFWTHLLLIVFMARFVIQLFILIAIKIAKRELEDKYIKSAIFQEIQKFKANKSPKLMKKDIKKL